MRPGVTTRKAKLMTDIACLLMISGFSDSFLASTNGAGKRVAEDLSQGRERFAWK